MILFLKFINKCWAGTHFEYTQLVLLLFFFSFFFHTGNLINGINYYFLKQKFHTSLVLVLGSRLIFAWLYKAVINLILI